MSFIIDDMLILWSSAKSNWTSKHLVKLTWTSAPRTWRRKDKPGAPATAPHSCGQRDVGPRYTFTWEACFANFFNIFYLHVITKYSSTTILGKRKSTRRAEKILQITCFLTCITRKNILFTFKTCTAFASIWIFCKISTNFRNSENTCEHSNKNQHWT